MGFVFWVKAITHKLRKKDQTTQILAPAMNLQKKTVIVSYNFDRKFILLIAVL